MKNIVFITAFCISLLSLTGQANAGLRLRSVMLRLEVNMEAIVGGITWGDFDTIESNARAIAEHEKPPLKERKKIFAFLKDDARGFKDADAEVHSGAIRLSELAGKKDYNEIIEAYSALLRGCVKCHNAYRDRIIKQFYREEDSHRSSMGVKTEHISSAR